MNQLLTVVAAGLLLLIVLGVANAQSKQLTRSIGSNEGFSNRPVWALLKDSKGFMWIGAGDGLWRYDGSDLVAYRNKDGDARSLSDNYIFSLHEDKAGKIWVGTLHGGVNRYDPRTDSFERMFPGDTAMTGCQVNDFVEDNKGNLWIATSRGLHRYDGKSLEHLLVTRGRLIEGMRSHIRSLYVAPDGKIWMGGYGGRLGCYDPLRKKFQYFKEIPFANRSHIKQIVPDEQGNLWLVRYGEGLVRFNPLSGEVRLWSAKEITQHESSGINSIQFFGQAAVLATSVGLISFDGSEFNRTGYGPDGVYGMEPANFYTLLVDDDRIWAGTEGHGIFVLYHGPALTIHSNPAPGKRLNHVWHGIKKVIMSFEDYGLVVIDTIRNQSFHIPMSPRPMPGAITGNLVWTLTEARQGNLWAGNNAGLHYIDYRVPSVKRVHPLIADLAEAIATPVVQVALDSSGALWVLTGSHWLRYDSSKRRFSYWRKKQGSGNSMYKMSAARAGMWLGSTDGGLTLFVPPGHMEHFVYDPENKSSLSNNSVSSLFTDSRNRTWIGTNQGLNLFNERTKSFERWGPSQGLVGAISDIAEDKYGNVLVQGSEGIFRLLRDSVDKSGSLLERLDGPIRFKPSEGVLHYPYFSWTSGNAIAQLRLDKIPQQTPAPPVVITSFQLDPNNRNPLDSAELRVNPVYREAITLDYDQNLFSIEFAALEFNLPEDVQYTYILEGFDENWTLSSSRRFVTYTNLDAGNYVFRVKTVGSESSANLKITIAPPPWETWWAYTAYGLMFIGLLLMGRKITVNRERLKAQVILEQKEKQTLRELDHLKTKFFSNITHEFRTPLTLIQGPADELLEKTHDNDARDLIGLIKSNSSRLLKLINQLLDLAKLDAREMKLNNSPANLAALMRVTISQFKSHAESKGVDFVWQISEMPVVQADAEKLETILTNLISNAIKFTPRRGKVSVQADWDNHHFVFTIRDTGYGIPAEKLPHIFDRFYQVSPTDSTHAEGTGIGLALVREYTEIMKGIIEVESKIGLGTTFTVKLPLTPADLPLQIMEPRHTLSNGSTTVESAPEENGQLPLVLLVEDNADLRGFIRTCLGKEFCYSEAGNGREGLTQALDQIPDLIISDLMMPEMDGLELCARLKKDKRTDHIPFIMLTAKAAEENKLEGLQTGADEYLVKPFNKAELLFKVQNLITLRQNLQTHIRTSILAQASDVRAESAEEQFVLRARLFVETHLKDETLNVVTLSQEMNLSREQCYRKLSALTGLAPLAFIRKIKLQRAHQLLSAQWGPVSQVAYEAGFENLSHFSKAFKEEFGKLPSEV